MMLEGRKSIFDIIKEEGEEDTAQADADQGQEEAPAPEESGEEDTGDDYGGEDDFNVDTTLDEEPDEGGGDMDAGDDSSGDLDSGGSLDSTEGEEEPVPANTDIFSSLTAEEQQVKIKELKRLFAELYTSTDDLLDKINDIETDESNIETISRISMMMYSLKQYISDYLTNVFAFKSYIENDIAFNRFLTILNSVTTVFNELSKEKLKNSDKK